MTTPGTSYEHPITLTIYSVDMSGPQPQAGTVLASVVNDVTVPFRPSTDPTCPDGESYLTGLTLPLCTNGFAFNWVFDLSTLGEVLPTEVIVTVGFDTQTYGANPIGIPGHYDLLNVMMAGTPSVGIDVSADVFWDAVTGGVPRALRNSVDDGLAFPGGLVMRILLSGPPAENATEPDETGLAATGPDTMPLVAGGMLLLLLGAGAGAVRMAVSRR